jgi:outer membrane receptor protein involved in Fe transport
MKVFRRGRSLGLGVVVGLAAILVTGPALAAIEEIRVSARKLDEDLQKVPVAITAIGAEEISRKGIVNLDRLVQQTPSVILDRGFGPQDQRVVVRGLSPTRGRQNVAILQDGFDISSESVTTGGGSLLINPRLFDLERVEIVKGPQNALYGRSAFAGAINYITRKPGDEFRGRAGVQVGNYGNQEASLQVSGPITEGFSAGVSGMIWSNDGYFDNAFTGDRLGGAEGASVAGTLVFEATDNLSITARVEHLDDKFGAQPFLNMPVNNTFAVPQAALDLGLTAFPTIDGVNGDAISASDMQPSMTEESRTCSDPLDASTCDDFIGTERQITRGTLTLDWDLGGVQFTSLTQFANSETFISQGGDDTSAAESLVVQEIRQNRETDLFSQEFRLSSNSTGPLQWVVGGLYWQEDVRLVDGGYTCINYTDLFAGFPNGPQPCGPSMALIGVDPGAPFNPARLERDTEHYSIYGLVEWEFIENFRVAFEARQVWEELAVGGPDFDRNLFDPSGTLCIFFGCTPGPQQGPGTINGVTTAPNIGRATEDDDFFAPKVTLTWNASDSGLLYASFAESFKPKGISLINGGAGRFFDASCGTATNPDCVDPVADKRFDQERLDVYELGFKSGWADNRVQLNGAFFFQDFKNKQVSQQVVDPATGLLQPRVVNAGKAEVLGFEVDVLWVPTDNLSMSLGYTFLDAEYKEYDQFTTSPAAPSYVGNCTPAVQETATGDVDGCSVDYSGNTLEGVAENALVGNARWQSPLVGETDWFLEGDFQFQDDRFSSDQNTLVFPSFWQFNFRTGITSDNLDLTFFVDNAFDDDTTRTGVAVGDIVFFALDQEQRFINRGRLYATDPRTFGVRMNYRFGAK